ncbi:MAG TPA: hypothetical protein VM077_04945 [Candidatus Limnocylindrales bacterium]|nr:hypothetical protein [Candidatus Limnocylindrales bacterium]
MRKKKKNLKYLITTAASLPLLAYLIYSFPPDFKLTIMGYQLSVIYLFFPLLFLSLLSTISLISKSSKHGLLFGLFAVCFLSFRLNGLTHPFFFLLLAALFLVLELLFSYRK